MAYGDHTGPDKPDKGIEGGSCNVSRCQRPGACFYNHAMRKWYCNDCGPTYRNDPFVAADGQRFFGHPMYETRDEIAQRGGVQP